MNTAIRVGGVLLSMSVSMATQASACPEHYFQGQAPRIQNPSMQVKARELCYAGFVVMHSGVTRTPLWVAERLDKRRVQQAEALDRQDSFHEETRLPEDERATLADYRGSGFDRGHMAPNGDMATRQQQADSFSLANMVPQSPTNNREVWRNLEEATRALVLQQGEAYVLTGPAFLGKQVQRIKRVLVPSDVYKVVYVPKQNAVGVYFAPNDESGKVSVISLAQLEQKLGIVLMPQLPAAVKQRRLDLPLNAAPRRAPSPRHQPSTAEAGEEATDGGWLSLLLRVLQQLLKP